MSVNDILRYLQQLQWIQKYQIPPGNRVPGTSNPIAVYCLYSQWGKNANFFRIHVLTLITSDLGQ